MYFLPLSFLSHAQEAIFCSCVGIYNRNNSPDQADKTCFLKGLDNSEDSDGNGDYNNYTY